MAVGRVQDVLFSTMFLLVFISLSDTIGDPKMQNADEIVIGSGSVIGGGGSVVGGGGSVIGGGVAIGGGNVVIGGGTVGGNPPH